MQAPATRTVMKMSQNHCIGSRPTLRASQTSMAVIPTAKAAQAERLGWLAIRFFKVSIFFLGDEGRMTNDEHSSLVIRPSSILHGLRDARIAQNLEHDVGAVWLGFFGGHFPGAGKLFFVGQVVAIIAE
jgi:hypothetical protein